MKRTGASRRRAAAHITMSRAARVHRLVSILAQGPHRREEILAKLQMGLRTFYRELELLRRCQVKIRLVEKNYVLRTTAEEAEGRLPFPDPQLSFAEMAELARGTGPAARRLAELLEWVLDQSKALGAPAKRRRGGKRTPTKKKP